MSNEPSALSHKLRLRVCGLLVESDAILLTQIHSPVNDKLVWAPPGGAVQYGEFMENGLKREFREETGLQIEVQQLIHMNELIRPPFHAVECYFEVRRTSGVPELGHDPEFPEDEQLLNDLQWKPLKKLDEIRFVPLILKKKLMRWEQRSSFSVFTPK